MAGLRKLTLAPAGGKFSTKAKGVSIMSEGRSYGKTVCNICDKKLSRSGFANHLRVHVRQGKMDEKPFYLKSNHDDDRVMFKLRDEDEAGYSPACAYFL